MRRRIPIGNMRRKLVVLATCVGALAGTSAVLAEAHDGKGHNHKQTADTVYVNGKVLLYKKHDRWAQAVAVDNGKISYVGGNYGARKLIGKKTEVIDLDGKTLMPGLTDGHLHESRGDACGITVLADTVEGLLGQLKDCLESPEQADLLHTNMLLFVGQLYSTELRATLTRDVLDRLSAAPGTDEFGTGTTRPIYVVHSGSHAFSVNSQAINNAGIDENTPDPQGASIGRYPNGVPNGLFADFGADWGPTAPPSPDAEYARRARDVEEITRKGITSFLRPGGAVEDLPTWKRLADDGKLTVRVNQAIFAGAAGWLLRGEDDPAVIKSFIKGLNKARNTYDGYTSPNSPGEIDVDSVKFLCDGVYDYPAHTAAMLEPYNENVGTAENPVWVPGTNRGEDPSCEDSVPGFVALDKAHWSIHVHSLGNRSARVALDNFAKARKINGRWDARHTITHLGFVHPSDMPRFGKLDVVASMTMNWTGRNPFSVQGIEGYISPEVLATQFPARSLKENGAVLAGGSDWPVTALLPWRQIEMAITREHNPQTGFEYETYPGVLTPHERISRLDSLKMHTQGAAYQMHLNAGEIEKGKLADLIVVDRNPMTIPVTDIEEIKVLTTILGGEVVFNDPDSGI